MLYIKVNPRKTGWQNEILQNWLRIASNGGLLVLAMITEMWTQIDLLHSTYANRMSHNYKLQISDLFC
jgi:hypothetical protein